MILQILSAPAVRQNTKYEWANGASSITVEGSSFMKDAAFLADPDWEPSDEELRELSERAWAAAELTHVEARRELDQ